MTNKELLDGYLAYLTARGRSKNYYNIMRIWLNYLEENKIETITQEVITNFFITNAQYKDGTKCMFIKAGRDYYSAYMQVPKEQNEWYKIKLLKIPQRIPEYFTEKELEEAKRQLVTNFSRKMTPLKIRTILDFLYYTGIRKAEILSLSRKDIDLENNRAKVYGKGKKERILCFPKKVSKELSEFFISENEEDSGGAFNLSLGKLHYIIKMINKYCGGKKIHCHSFRHGYAKTCLKKGVDLPTLSRLLGHASVLTTMVYANPSDEEMQENYQAKMNKGKDNEN
jgi:site-specific recombinase XerD